jgi:hypothetical protein
MLRFLNTMRDDLLKIFDIIYQKLHIGYHELLMNLIVTPDFTRKTECISHVRQD